MFTFGGIGADAGLTGRKIIVDTYGGWAAHSGNAFSGRDASKLYRSSTYAARWVAKSLVNAKLCNRVMVQLVYSFESKDPVGINIETYGTIKEGLTETDLFNIIVKNFDLKSLSIIRDLDLKKPKFSKATNSHFGKEIPELTWEYPKKLEF